MKYLKIFHYSPSQKLRNTYQNEGIKSRKRKAYRSRKEDPTPKGGEGNPTDDNEGKGGFQADC